MKENLYQDYFDLARQFATRLLDKNCVVGICFLGGIGLRQKTDRYSDIDLAVFIDQKKNGGFLPTFSFAVNLKGRLVEFNVSQHAMDDPQNDLWDEARIAAYQNAHLFFDRDGSIQTMLDKHVAQAPINMAKIACNLNQAWWKGVYHSFAMSKRDGQIAAHLLLNEALLLILDTLVMLGGKHRTHTKWVVSELTHGKVEGVDLKLIEEALKLPDTSQEAFLKRRSHVTRLYKHALKQARRQFPSFPNSPYKFWAEHLSHRQIGTDRPIEAFITRCATTHDLTPLERKRIHGALSFAPHY